MRSPSSSSSPSTWPWARRSALAPPPASGEPLAPPHCLVRADPPASRAPRPRGHSTAAGSRARARATALVPPTMARGSRTAATGSAYGFVPASGRDEDSVLLLFAFHVALAPPLGPGTTVRVRGTAGSFPSSGLHRSARFEGATSEGEFRSGRIEGQGACDRPGPTYRGAWVVDHRHGDGGVGAGDLEASGAAAEGGGAGRGSGAGCGTQQSPATVFRIWLKQPPASLRHKMRVPELCRNFRGDGGVGAGDVEASGAVAEGQGAGGGSGAGGGAQQSPVTVFRIRLKQLPASLRHKMRVPELCRNFSAVAWCGKLNAIACASETCARIPSSNACPPFWIPIHIVNPERPTECSVFNVKAGSCLEYQENGLHEQ